CSWSPGIRTSYATACRWPTRSPTRWRPPAAPSCLPADPGWLTRPSLTAGGAVVITLLSLAVAGTPLVTALGLASAIAVVAAVVCSITLLPALLGLLKHRVHWASLPALLGPRPKPGHGMWHSWAQVVRRHPIVVGLLATVALVPLIIPVFSLELGQEDIVATAPGTTERQAYDLITAGFGVGYNGPLQVASAMDPPAQPSAEYTKKYNQATSLKKELHQAQK